MTETETATETEILNNTPKKQSSLLDFPTFGSSSPTYFKFPPLFQRKVNGRIYEWNKEVTHIDGQVNIITSHGYQNGKIQSNTKIITKGKGIGKAKKTVWEQALSDAKSDWNLKINKGGYVEDLDKVQDQSLYHGSGEGMKSDSIVSNVCNLVIRPMLAKTLKPELYVSGNKSRAAILKFPCYGQPKLDGNRALVHLNPETKEVEIMTRSGTKLPENLFFEIREELDNLMQLADPQQTGEFYLDGELFSWDLTFNALNGLCNRTKLKVMKPEQYENISKVSYYIFDCFNIRNLKHPFDGRYTILQTLFHDMMPKPTKLELVECEYIKDFSGVDPFHDFYAHKGYEGLILRNTDGPYELKKRSTHLQKYKKFMEEEFKIVAYHEGTGTYKGTPIWDCETNVEPRSVFAAKLVGSRDYWREVFPNSIEYIGKWITVKFQEYTDEEHGIPRFPVAKDFRDKKEFSS